MSKRIVPRKRRKRRSTAMRRRVKSGYMQKKPPWSRADKLTAATVVIGLLGIVVALLFPEVRRKLGLEKPVPVAAETHVSQSQAPATTTPNTSPPQSRTRPKVKSKPTPAPSQALPVSQECAPGASCAQSSGQQGGITAGTINVGPPPLTFRWTVKDVPSTKPDLAFEKQISVTASTLFTPVSIGVACDSDIESIDSQFEGNGVYLNQRSGTDDNNKKMGFVSFDSPAMTPERPLFIWIWSKTPLKVLDVKRAIVNNK